MDSLSPANKRSLNRILLATDFSSSSKAAYDQALRICLSFRACLTILYVFTYPEVVLPESGVQLFDLEEFREAARGSLNKLVAEATDAGVACTGLIEDGTTSWMIYETVRSRKIDLVVLGTRGLAGLDRAFFGSTTETALRTLPCPVLAVGPRAHQLEPGIAAGPVVFATDFHESTVPTVEYAELFSLTMQVPLHCVNVLPEAIRDGAPTQIVPQIITDALHRVVSHETPSTVCAVTYGSEIASAIVDYASKHNASMIVLGVRHASMLASHLPAHIAYRIMKEATCPVLAKACVPVTSAPPVASAVSIC